MSYKTIKYQIDDLTYLIIDNIIKEKTVSNGRMLETNQAIGMIIEKAFNQFILDHQEFVFENYNRRNSLLDEKLQGKEIKFEDVFNTMTIIPEIKEGD